MKEQKATQLAVKTMVLSELTGIDPDSVIRYFAALEAFPDAGLMQISAITKVDYAKLQDLRDADRDIHVWL